MNNRDLFIYAQTKKSKRTLSETKSTLSALIDRSITRIEFPDGITEIGVRAFSDCTNLLYANIPDSVTAIRANAFYGCTNLQEVILPSGLRIINAYTFYENYNLQTINMPSSLVRIETGAFLQCNSLTNITLPSGVRYLRNQAFYDCRGLKTISIPNSITEFGDRAFGLCSSLENVVFEGGFNANGLDLSASTLYSVNTLVTMLNALANRTGQVPYTLTLGSTNLAKLSNEQLAIATEKNWTLA